MIRAVVNKLAFREPIGPSVRDAAGEGARRAVDAGAVAFLFVEVDETHAMLVILFPDLETEERVSRDVGGPWMRERILRLLAEPPERTTGEVVAGAGL